MIPRLLVVFTWQLEIVVTTLATVPHLPNETSIIFFWINVLSNQWLGRTQAWIFGLLILQAQKFQTRPFATCNTDLFFPSVGTGNYDEAIMAQVDNIQKEVLSPQEHNFCLKCNRDAFQTVEFLGSPIWTWLALRLCLTSQEDCIKADNQIRAILIFILLKTSKFNALLDGASFV